MKMTNNQIASAITGKPVSEVNKTWKEDEEIFRITKRLMLLIGKLSKSSHELKSHLATLMVMTVTALDIKDRKDIFNMAASISLTGKDIELHKEIQKFVED